MPTSFEWKTPLNVWSDAREWKMTFTSLLPFIHFSFELSFLMRGNFPHFDLYEHVFIHFLVQMFSMTFYSQSYMPRHFSSYECPNDLLFSRISHFTILCNVFELLHWILLIRLEFWPKYFNMHKPKSGPLQTSSLTHMHNI